MDKKTITAIVVILILLVGGYGAYRVYNHFKRLAAPAMMQTSEMGSGTKGSAMSSLKELIGKGIAQSCTYTSDKAQGTIYMSGGNVRADIDTMVGSVSTKAHMLMMDKTGYIWTDGMTTGFKMAYDLNATPVPGASPSNAQQAIDANASMNYNCSPWVADASKFTLPAGIKFATFAMPAAGSAQPAPQQGASSSQCSYCDSLSGDAKTQCLAALKCN